MIPPTAERALALIGYPVQAARVLRDFGLISLGVPDAPLAEVLRSCEVLGFAGALVHPAAQQSIAEHLQLDPDARRANQADAVTFAGGPHGTYAAPEAILGAVQDSQYAARGANAVLIGLSGDLRLGLGLGRLGLRNITVVAETRPEAERVARDLPAGLAAFALTHNDAALRGLAERADLLILTGGNLPPGLAQPYHTVLDLTPVPSRDIEKAGATLLTLPDLPARILSRQIEHATGQRFRPSASPTW